MFQTNQQQPVKSKITKIAIAIAVSGAVLVPLSAFAADFVHNIIG